MKVEFHAVESEAEGMWIPHRVSPARNFLKQINLMTKGDRMKKLVLCGLIGALPAASAYAQTNVTVFGVIDEAVYYSAHMLNQDPLVGAPADPQVAKLASGSVAGLTNGGVQMSRIGFKGSEDLGDGLKAIFMLENRFLPNNGAIDNGAGSVANLGTTKAGTSGGDSSIDGELFNGQANVGLQSSRWGTAVFGRVITLGNDVITDLDPMHASLMFSPLGYSGQYAGLGFTEEARADNAIKYTNQVGAINYGLLYKLGGVSGNTSAGSAISASVGYTSGPLNIQGVYARNNDAVAVGASGVPGTVALTFADTVGYAIGANYQFDRLKLYAGVEYHKISPPSNPLVDAATSTIYGLTVTGTPNTTAYVHNKTQLTSWLGATLNVAPAFDVTAALYNARQNDYSGGLCTSNGNAVASCSGNNEFASLLADYRLSKRTDLYAGYLFNRVTGGYDVVGTLHSSNNFFGSGIRVVF